MRKQLLAFLLAFLLLLSPTVLAHSGKTDSNGGHYDRSTGEYHYHHGYPAHQHYDMDGDGIIDCPYDFDDKTDHSSRSDSGSSHAVQSTPRPSPQKSDGSKAKHISVGGIIAAAILVPIFVLEIGAALYAFICIPIRSLIDRIKEKRRKK